MNTLELLKNEAARTLTENGAATLSTTRSDCLDMFALGGVLRDADEVRVKNIFARAFAENPDIALRILFYLRDVRGGLGERKTFRAMLKTLADTRKDSLVKNIGIIAEFGRWDDLLCLLGTPAESDALALIKTQLESDIEAEKSGGEISLLAKWLPSINASNVDARKAAKKVAVSLGMNLAQYRKTLSALRAKIKIIENSLREKDYTFDYGKQCSGAMFKYKKAFLRNDGGRYKEFLGKVEKGEEKLKTGTLYPYDIVAPIAKDFNGVFYGRPHKFSDDEIRAMNATWNALEDYTSGENAIVVCDTSGSMYYTGNPLPASVAMSLSIYFAERNTGAFKNHFISFSEKPELVEIKGADIVEKVRYVMSRNLVANTNLDAVFNLILRTAVKNHLAQSDLPGRIYIISDMEFDQCVHNAGATNFENAKREFSECGYELPEVVFWNVQSRNDTIPVSKDESGVTLVSGASARIFSMMKAGALTPYDFMLSVINAERYAKIAA